VCEQHRAILGPWTQGTFCFGEFTLDLAGGFLRRGGTEVPLQPKPFEVLAYLVEHKGRFVSKSALIAAVWPDTAVTNNSLAQCLVEIRRALGDDSQRLIRTLARRGYVFTATVTSPVVEFPQAPAAASAESAPGLIPRRRELRIILITAVVFATDPVCGMKIDPGTAAAHRSTAAGIVYFCSTGCATAFDSEPGRYAAAATAGAPASGAD